MLVTYLAQCSQSGRLLVGAGEGRLDLDERHAEEGYQKSAGWVGVSSGGNASGKLWQFEFQLFQLRRQHGYLKEEERGARELGPAKGY